LTQVISELGHFFKYKETAPMKLAVIGGGSSYTPELLDGLFSRLDSIPVKEVWMMDKDAGRLGINVDFARRMAESHGSPFTVQGTTDLREAVRDAKYVVTQIRVGGMQARINDEKLGLRHGIIGQETTGVGGFACALRTIPRILDIARAMEELSPEGFLVNFTNPAGINTEAVLKHSKIRTVGLCNVPIGMIMGVIKLVGGTVEDIELDYVGLNHLSWVRGYKKAGVDITQELLLKLEDHVREEWEDERTQNNMLAAQRSLGMFCNYYLQYYYSTDAVLETLKKKEKTRGEEVVEIEQKLFDKYRDPELNEKPEELSKRGGAHYSTAAFHLIDAIENNRQSRQIVCCRNNGAIPAFDDDVSVEISAMVGKDGAKAIPQSAPAPIIRGLMQLVKAYESLTVEAAVSGDREKAFQAMLLHPLMPDATGCRTLLNEVLEINKPYLHGTFF
jgi:6-phospho-beta-glucosidase